MPHTNKRTDDWGGSVENRHRLPVEVVRAVRDHCGPDFMIIYRISAADLIENGAPAEEIALLAGESRGCRRRYAEHRYRLA